MSEISTVNQIAKNATNNNWCKPMELHEKLILLRLNNINGMARDYYVIRCPSIKVRLSICNIKEFYLQMRKDAERIL